MESILPISFPFTTYAVKPERLLHEKKCTNFEMQELNCKNDNAFNENKSFVGLAPGNLSPTTLTIYWFLICLVRSDVEILILH